MKSLAQILTIYNWVAVCILLFFLFGIARFFEQRRSEKKNPTGKKRRVYYQLFLVPVVLFITSAVIYTISETVIVGNTLADTLYFIGGLVLTLSGYSLLSTMTGGRS